MQELIGGQEVLGQFSSRVGPGWASLVDAYKHAWVSLAVCRKEMHESGTHSPQQGEASPDEVFYIPWG
eukprot:10054948-Alexandrium_andersonii.AAC.1